MPALGKARQAVVGNRLPRRRVRDELPHRRTDARVLVERPHADPDRLGVRRSGAEQRRPALPAEPLLAAVLRRPDAQLVLARDDPERVRRRMRLRRGGRTAPPLAALAVAVARSNKRLGDLLADCAAVAAARERELHLTMMPVRYANPSVKLLGRIRG